MRNYYYEIMKYKDSQLSIQQKLFSNKMGGEFNGKKCECALQNYQDNFVKQIDSNEVEAYFKDNGINWWKGRTPTTHTLSSQIACINHLYSIRTDYDAVLAVARQIDQEIDSVDILYNDKEKWRGYISFEVVSEHDHLNEKRGKNKKLTRGSQCTSIDAVILAHKKDRHVLLAIEWKYVEQYYNEDKSKNQNGKQSGSTRVNNYTGGKNVPESNLIQKSKQLKNLNTYEGSVYFYEPFYQLMRQTLWAEQMVKYRDEEIIKADDYINVHVIPTKNVKLRDKIYKCSNMDLRSTWVQQLNDASKYILISPDKLFETLPCLYNDLKKTLENRYWQ